MSARTRVWTKTSGAPWRIIVDTRRYPDPAPMVLFVVPEGSRWASDVRRAPAHHRVASDLDVLVASGHVRPGAAVVVTGPSAVPGVWAKLLRAAGCVPFVLGQNEAERAFVDGLVTILRARDTRSGDATP